MNRRAFALLPLVAMVGFVAVPVAWHFSLSPVAAMSTGMPPLLLTATLLPDGPSNSDLEVALLRAGISAQSLAAVGLSSQSLAGLVDAAQTHFALHATDLSAADAAYAAAKPACDQARRTIESGKGSQEDVATFQAQSAAVTAASTAQTAALDALRDAATASLSSDQRASLQRIHAARTWGLPTEFCVVERSQEAWVELRSALANERFAAKYGEEMLPAAQALLSVERSSSPVAAAKTGIDTNLSALTTVWTSALAD